MIAVAIYLVWQHGFDNLPYFHKHVWISEDWNHAIVELVDWEKETEQYEHVTLKCLEWWMHERSDIGV